MKSLSLDPTCIYIYLISSDKERSTRDMLTTPQVHDALNNSVFYGFWLIVLFMLTWPYQRRERERWFAAKF